MLETMINLIVLLVGVGIGYLSHRLDAHWVRRATGDQLPHMDPSSHERLSDDLMRAQAATIAAEGHVASLERERHDLIGQLSIKQEKIDELLAANGRLWDQHTALAVDLANGTDAPDAEPVVSVHAGDCEPAVGAIAPPFGTATKMWH